MDDAVRAAAEALFSSDKRVVGRKAPPKVDTLGRVAIAKKLREIEHQVARLTVSHRDPEKFHEDRSEIKQALNELASQIEGR